MDLCMDTDFAIRMRIYPHIHPRVSANGLFRLKKQYPYPSVSALARNKIKILFASSMSQQLSSCYFSFLAYVHLSFFLFFKI
uniref:Uncharacterized protein n=1 Tax=Meloidogyne incognita TaxID=6306 RepID=A0A914LIN2_MELIC